MKDITSPPPPSWVERKSEEVSGVDLLGLRMPVNTVGYGLLDGVTTISPMVRYVSLRAWITDFYGRLRLEDLPDAFTNFAKRVESAVVMGNLLRDAPPPNLIGSNEARRELEASGGKCPLARLVKLPAANIYLGPSLELNVAFKRSPGIAGLTEERGLPLAQAADEALGRTALARELERNPALESLDRAALEELGAAFPLDAPGERERECLLAAILPEEPRPEAEMNRVVSYGILLEIAERTGTLEEHDILKAAVDPDSPLLRDYEPWLDRWACYLVLDMLAVVHEAALGEMLRALEDAGGGPVRGPELVRGMLSRDDEIEASLNRLGLLPEGPNPLDAPLERLAEQVDRRTETTRPGRMPRWDGLCEQALIAEAGGQNPRGVALLPAAWLLARARHEKGGTGKGDLSRHLFSGGWGRMGVGQVVIPGLEDMLRREVTLRGAMEQLALRTMDQHVRIAWARLAADPSKDVALLTVDGPLWSVRPKKDFRPGRTASRLVQAMGWLRQLGLVDGGACTERGRQCLERIRGLVREKGGNE
ncbi:MAG: hypothetical protein GX580_14435 [Candidatus Hydrogenedens sp.]|nr:hypothetical protein [Candidatus Hydrogenedens sp.]